MLQNIQQRNEMKCGFYLTTHSTTMVILGQETVIGYTSCWGTDSPRTITSRRKGRHFQPTFATRGNFMNSLVSITVTPLYMQARVTPSPTMGQCHEFLPVANVGGHSEPQRADVSEVVPSVCHAQINFHTGT